MERTIKGRGPEPGHANFKRRRLIDTKGSQKFDEDLSWLKCSRKYKKDRYDRYDTH